MQCNDFTAYFRYDCKVASKSCPSSLAPTVGTVGHQRMVFHPNRLVKKIDKRLQITGLSLLSWWTDHQYRCHDLRRRHGGQRHAERRPEGLRNHKTSHDGIAMVSQKHAITYVDGLKLSYSYHKIWYWASICQVFFWVFPRIPGFDPSGNPSKFASEVRRRAMSSTVRSWMARSAALENRWRLDLGLL